MLSNQKSGFGLIEVVIASGILVLIAGGSLALSKTVLNGTIKLSDRTAASYLAVESIELVEEIRDTNYIDENPATVWNSGLGDGSYGLRFTGSAWILDPAANNQEILINNISYHRSIVITTLNDGTSRKRIQANLNWGSPNQALSLSTILADSRVQP